MPCSCMTFHTASGLYFAFYFCIFIFCFILFLPSFLFFCFTLFLSSLIFSFLSFYFSISYLQIFSFCFISIFLFYFCFFRSYAAFSMMASALLISSTPSSHLPLCLKAWKNPYSDLPFPGQLAYSNC